MTEEEKKAIEIVKEIWQFTDYSTDKIALKVVLDLIKKLQKENEKWKENARIAEENDTTLVLDVNQACKELGISEDTIIADELADKIKEKYILKDKIREIATKLDKATDWLFEEEGSWSYCKPFRDIAKELEELSKEG